MSNEESWAEQARCVDVGAAVMDLNDDTMETSANARWVCSRCPVRTQCLRAALAEEGSVRAAWRATMRGGLLPLEREVLARTLRRAGHETRGPLLSESPLRELVDAAMGAADAVAEVDRERLRRAAAKGSRARRSAA